MYLKFLVPAEPQSAKVVKSLPVRLQEDQDSQATVGYCNMFLDAKL